MFCQDRIISITYIIQKGLALKIELDWICAIVNRCLNTITVLAHRIYRMLEVTSKLTFFEMTKTNT